MPLPSNPDASMALSTTGVHPTAVAAQHTPTENDHSTQSETETNGPVEGERKFCHWDGCGRSYRWNKDLNSHMRKHTGDIPYSCATCNKRFVQKRDSLVHERTYTLSRERSYKCPYAACGRDFFYHSTLQKHTRKVHTGEKPHVCTFDGCGVRFLTARQLRRHLVGHTGQWPFLCIEPTCTRTTGFMDAVALKSHMRKHRTFACFREECGRTFEKAEGLATHISEHTGETADENMRASDAIPDTPQNENEHGADTETSDNARTRERTCTWDGCGKVLTGKYDLVKHLRVHTGEKPFACGVCGKRFTQKGHLPAHERTHTKERPYKCMSAGCEHSCTTSSALRLHERREHTGEKLCVCTYDGCGMQFLRADYLRKHMSSHTGEWPYMCSEPACGKGFTQACDLKVHVRTHTDEQPFGCPHEGCGKMYKSKATLKKHMQKHTGERPHKCIYEGCGASFVDSSTLKGHLQAHWRGDGQFLETNVRIVPRARLLCTHTGCAKTFQNKELLDVHLARHGTIPCLVGGCKSRCTSRDDLNVHMTEHAGEKLIDCTFEGCEKKFRHRNTFDGHMRMHTGDTFNCVFEGCTRRFPDQNNLIMHMRKHTGEKPFACMQDGCGKRFTRVTLLNRHTKLYHT